VLSKSQQIRAPGRTSFSVIECDHFNGSLHIKDHYTH
jgi:hypothetical protein